MQLKKFICKYCKKRFVIMPTHNNSLLPVEVDGKVYDGEEVFDSKHHLSHLLNCKGRQEDWEWVKKIYLEFPQKTFVDGGY